MPRTHTVLDLVPATQPHQVAFVVPDLAEAIRTWSRVLKREDWSVYSYGPESVDDLRFRGAPASFSMRLALCGSNPQIELIESLAGPSSYSEWTASGARGVHHLGYFVEAIRPLMAEFEALGFVPVQSGHGYGLDGDGGFAYYEIPGIDVIVEFIEVPRRRKPTESVPLPQPSER